MNRQEAKPHIDELLLAFLREPDESESTALLERLICNHAQPLIQNILHFKLRASDWRRSINRGGQEIEDLSNEVILRLVRTLRECKAAPQDRPIANLRSYVAVMAYNASDEYLRQKYPRRFSLKNKVRYILTHQAGLALWEDEVGEMVCGLAAWQRLKRPGGGAAALSHRQNELITFLQRRFPGKPIEQVSLVDLISAVLEFSDTPVELDKLVTILAELLELRETETLSETERAAIDNQLVLSSDPRERMDASFDHRARLETVWREVQQLPLRQRLALLLNLRDEQGDSAIVLLPILRIATLRQIAEALGMTEEEMATIWNDLPLEDALIAERLGATRQQVINLRKCARERLTRRLATTDR